MTMFLRAAGAASALALACQAVHAAPTCVPIQGKIVNNIATPTGGTLGVVAAVYGRGSSALKLKCALVGDPQGATFPALAFVHSFSCDDSIDVATADGSVPVHSSLVLATSGMAGPPQSSTQLFTFAEQAVPYTAAPFRGVFYGVTGGSIDVEGAVYKSPLGGDVPGSIDMKFSGQLCYGG